MIDGGRRGKVGGGGGGNGEPETSQSKPGCLREEGIREGFTRKGSRNLNGETQIDELILVQFFNGCFVKAREHRLGKELYGHSLTQIFLFSFLITSFLSFYFISFFTLLIIAIGIPDGAFSSKHFFLLP